MEQNKKPFTWIHRLLHWGIALPMMLLLLTIGLREGWMEKYHMALLIEQGLSDAGLALSNEQTVIIAKSIRGVMFGWHLYAGYVIGVMLLLRGMYYYRAGIFYRDSMLSPTIHERFQGWLYGLFYLFLGLSVLSGLLFVYGGDWVPSRVKEIHELGLWFFIPFLIFHLAGMILAETGEQSGLVSKMFGRK